MNEPFSRIQIRKRQPDRHFPLNDIVKHILAIDSNRHTASGTAWKFLQRMHSKNEYRAHSVTRGWNSQRTSWGNCPGAIWLGVRKTGNYIIKAIAASAKINLSGQRNTLHVRDSPIHRF